MVITRSSLFLAGLTASVLCAAQVAPSVPSRTTTVPPKTVSAVTATKATTDTLAWSTDMFRDMGRQDLPYIHVRKPIGVSSVGVTAYLTDAQYVPLSPAEIKRLPGLGNPGAEPEIQASVGIARKRPQALVNIYPYRRNQGSGQLERLVSYHLQLVEESRSGGGTMKSASYPDHSKMASGSWYRFTVPQDGVYELTYDFLQQLGVSGTIASDRINVYGNHAGPLPFTNSPAPPNDLLVNAVEMVDGGDGQFDPGDRILFYATGPQRWNLNSSSRRFEHTKNVYSDSASYFIGLDVELPKRVTNASVADDPATDQVTVFSDRQFIDRDLVNLVKSGRTWFAETYDLTLTYNYNFSTPFLHAGDSAYLVLNAFGRTFGISNTSTFQVQAGSFSGSMPIGGVSNNSNGEYGKLVKKTFGFPATGSSIPITVTFQKFDPTSSMGWMNYLELNARRDLKMVGEQLTFRDPASVGAGRIGEFTLDLATTVHRIWEVTDPSNVRQIPFTDNGAQKTFRLNTDSLREFIAFKNSGYLAPQAVGPVPNQDLHATASNTDLMIICPPEFQGQAQRLADQRASEGLSVVMVSPQQVFNEFSSGQRDATAIKRYMKMLYDRAGSDPLMLPRYLLLFGDGSYNNIVTASSNQNYIPTYETADSWTPAYNYVSDDYYGLLDDSEGEYTGDLVDIGIGRLPVSDGTQAREAVNKILNYDRLLVQSNTGASCTSGSDGGSNDWRNWVLFASDDQTGDSFEGPIHMVNSEALANKLDVVRPCLNSAKIYMDAYVQYSTPGGERYPDAQNELRDRVQKGCLLVNYVGHGGEVGWAHERLLDNSTILGWSNLERLPLFMTATCEFTRWDDPARTSAGEYVFLNPNGGGIGLMSTTRIAYSSQNQALATFFFDHAFQDEDDQGRAQRFGDIYRETKIDITDAQPNSANHRNFTLIGDPTTRLALARNEAFISSVTDTLGNPVDTMSALSVIRINGYIGDQGGQPLTDFNGVVIPTVFDKKSTVSTLANDGGQPFNFSVRRNIIYRGKVSVVNGYFSLTFMVPKDINYQVGPGRISIYAESLTSNACGYSDEKLVGGTNPDAVADDLGPKIELYMNDERFVPGGLTNESPLLYAKLFDANGINTTGTSIGHDLTAVIDANTENALVLNDVYEADLDTWKSGKVRYRLNDLAEGAHTLSMKAWDVFNNSGTKSVDFVVAPSAQLALEHVLNYPNPFTTHTDFYFEHNRPCGVLDVQVQVFTVAGRLVKTLNRQLACDGFRSEPMPWDGLDDYGDKLGRGVYVYRLTVGTEAGESAEKIEKLVILR